MTKTEQSHFGSFLEWARENTDDPATAAANWLARDIDPDAVSAVHLLTNPTITLQQLEQAKDVYKTMRLIGETAADRRLGGRLYLASIASALVFHKTRISRQSTAAIIRALMLMQGEPSAPLPLKRLAGSALNELAESFQGGYFAASTRTIEQSPPNSSTNERTLSETKTISKINNDQDKA